MDQRVVFIDTSVLCNIVGVPGRSQLRDETRRKLQERADAGELFVIPVTAVIETGNHIANAGGDRRAAAQQLVALLRASVQQNVPWQLNAVQWDEAFIEELCNGDGTGQPLIDLLGNAQFGTGDVAILTEMDQYRRRTSFAAVTIWTLEAGLAAFS